MEHLKKIKKKAMEELEEYGQKKELSMGDYTTIHMLTDTIKNIDKICMLEEGGGYSEAMDMDRYSGGWMMPPYSMAGRGGGGGGSNAGGGGSSNGGQSYGGRSGEENYSQQRRDSRGRYSRDSGEKERIVRDIEKMTDKFSDAEWDVLEDFVRRFRQGA